MKITKDIKFAQNQAGVPISLCDLFDDSMKAAYNLTDEEYDFICERATDDEIGLLVNEKPTFSQKREMLKIRRRLLDLYNAQ